ncbi:hypothetical protein A8708_08700 [Paenibacillus oryzisoli]|uniref:Uncharacterized protein n=1 Tax=Paenibacillus oryzisoli TaxID=1850517 RepID=A0A198AMD7_9BACL|nr:hypothetical protein A8708_08700 [Paenibacillus oryzisoli]
MIEFKQYCAFLNRGGLRTEVAERVSAIFAQWVVLGEKRNVVPLSLRLSPFTVGFHGISGTTFRNSVKSQEFGQITERGSVTVWSPYI